MRNVRNDDRFWDNVEITDGCWLWRGMLDQCGYGTVTRNGSSQRAHRYAYEGMVGHIPDGLELDHLCRVRHCINPDHLDPVTHRENLMRSPDVLTAINARKTHCIHGHEFTPENTYRRPNRPNSRVCRACRRDEQRRLKARRRAAATA